jgi:transcriptional regulator with XRE-family HTH domain
MDELAFGKYEGHTAVLMASELWQRLRQARRFADLTQLDLATRCNVSRGAVALWESAEPEHRTRPTTEHLINVAKTTGVPLEWLLNDVSDLDAIWRLNGEYGDRRPPTDVLPDLRQSGHLFVFAQTAEQIAAKLAVLADEPPETTKHLILVGVDAAVHTAKTPADALSAVVRQLTDS